MHNLFILAFNSQATLSTKSLCHPAPPPKSYASKEMKFAALLVSAFVATAVQASQVDLHYCQEGDKCFDASIEAELCTDLKHPGYLTSISNTAHCLLFGFPDCRGRSNVVRRGTSILQKELVVSVQCYEPGLSRNLAPAVQASEVVIKYCLKDGPCFDENVEPYQCTYLKVSGHIESIQNTANCELFSLPDCGGRSIPVRRGSTGLRGPLVQTIKCSEPGFQRNQRPMRSRALN